MYPLKSDVVSEEIITNLNNFIYHANHQVQLYTTRTVECPDWMTVVGEMTIWEARIEYSKIQSNRNPRWDEERSLCWKAVCDTDKEDIWHSVWENSTWKIDFGYKRNDAAGYASTILMDDAKIDTTWLKRWWDVWELEYFPIKERNNKLEVIRLIEGRKILH